MKIDLRILDPRITEEMLKPKTAGSAGIDLCAILNDSHSTWWIYPGQAIKVNTGIAIHINDPGYCAIVLPRSGLGSKGLILGNTIGLIDSDYQGEIILSIWNRSADAIKIEPLMRIAQLIVIPVMVPEFNVVQSFSETERGSNGFGSTGV